MYYINLDVFQRISLLEITSYSLKMHYWSLSYYKICQLRVDQENSLNYRCWIVNTLCIYYNIITQWNKLWIISLYRVRQKLWIWPPVAVLVSLVMPTSSDVETDSVFHLHPDVMASSTVITMKSDAVSFLILLYVYLA